MIESLQYVQRDTQKRIFYFELMTRKMINSPKFLDNYKFWPDITLPKSLVPHKTKKLEVMENQANEKLLNCIGYWVKVKCLIDCFEDSHVRATCDGSLGSLQKWWKQLINQFCETGKNWNNGANNIFLALLHTK